MNIDINDEERQLLARWAELEWTEADKIRMKTRPDSKNERYWLEYQQMIERLQSKLRAVSVPGSR